MGVEAGLGVRTNFIDSHLSIAFLYRARIESSIHTARAQPTVEWFLNPGLSLVPEAMFNAVRFSRRSFAKEGPHTQASIIMNQIREMPPSMLQRSGFKSSRTMTGKWRASYGTLRPWTRRCS
jgi:hypothetical protein